LRGDELQWPGADAGWQGVVAVGSQDCGGALATTQAGDAGRQLKVSDGDQWRMTALVSVSVLVVEVVVALVMALLSCACR